MLSISSMRASYFSHEVVKPVKLAPTDVLMHWDTGHKKATIKLAKLV